jgi:hypothetical protein
MFDPRLMIAPDIGGQMKKSFEDGRQQGMQNKARAAMAALARDPNNQGALEALASVDPQAAMQFRQQQQEAALKGLEVHREKIGIGAGIIEQVQPKDQAGWDQVLSLAQQMRIDISDVPKVWDETAMKYADGMLKIHRYLNPQREDKGRIITPQPGAGAWMLNPDGSIKELIKPNDGSQPMGAPAQAGGVQEGATATNPQTGEKIVFRGGQWQPMGGATGQPPSPTFP